MAHYARAIDIVEASEGADSLSVAQLCNDAGVACKFAGRYDDAEAYYVSAVALIERLEGRECDDYATLLHNLGGLAHARGRYAEGVAPARAGLELRERLHGPVHPDVGGDCGALAALLEGAGDLEEAEHLYRRAVKLLDVPGKTHEAAMARNGLGSVCQSRGRHDAADRHYRAALAQLEDLGGGDHPSFGHVLNNLATLQRARGLDDEARALLARAHDLLVRTLGPDHPVTIGVAGNKGRVDESPSPYV